MNEPHPGTATGEAPILRFVDKCDSIASYRNICFPFLQTDERKGVRRASFCTLVHDEGNPPLNLKRI